jgi:hypothetical protein
MLIYFGEFPKAEAELMAAQDIFDKHGVAKTNYVSVVRSFRASCALLSGDALAAFELAQQARTLADEVAKRLHPFERDFILAEWLLGASLVMRGRDLNAAALHLTESSRIRTRHFARVGTLAPCEGQPAEARTYADEALAIVDRCEYCLCKPRFTIFSRVSRWMRAIVRRRSRKQRLPKNARGVMGRPTATSRRWMKRRKMLKELGAKK